MNRFFLPLLLLLAPLTTVAEQNLVFILDASGSMWGRVQGEPKITIARDVMADLVGELPADSRAGLIAYGHNRKGDCDDIETLVPLGPLQREELIERIRALNPKGKTPITASVRRAVEHLRTLESAASVVLVSDGLESCGGDPCAAVREAREAGVDFRLHVVGFDLGEQDSEQLQCMARAADGRYFSAGNADELSEALKQAVAVSPALQLTVTANGEPAAARVFIEPAGGGDEVARASVGDSGESNPRRIELPAGDYDVLIRAQGIAGEPEKHLTGITIPEEGEVERRVDFSAGKLEVTVTANGEPLKARTYIYRADSDEEASRGRTDKDGLVDYEIPPGEYRITVRPDGIDAPDQTVEGVVVTGGETSRQTVEFSAGTLVAHITTNGEPLKARTYVLNAETGKEASRGRTDKNGAASYEIPPGEYRIKVRPDGIDAPDQMIDGVVVTAGEIAEHSLDIPSGAIVLTVENGGEPLKARTYLRDPEIDKEVSRSRTDNQGQASYRVPVGNYTLRIRPDGIDAQDRVVETVSVASGRTAELRVDFAEEQ